MGRLAAGRRARRGDPRRAGGVDVRPQTLRVDQGDARWFLRWPARRDRALRPARGYFDPGQRLASVAFVGAFATVVVSGVALTTLSGGSTFATMVRVHRGATYVLVPSWSAT